jgi:hypothetical protein
MRWLALVGGVLVATGGGIDLYIDRAAGHELSRASERLSAQLTAAAAAAKLRAEALAAMPVVRASVETDAATLRDVARSDFVFAPALDETIEVFQVGHAGPVSLLRLPVGSPAVTPARRTEMRLEPDGEGLRVVAHALVHPLYKHPVEGLVSVARHLRVTTPFALDGPGEVSVTLPLELATQQLALVGTRLTYRGWPLMALGAPLLVAGLILLRRRKTIAAEPPPAQEMWADDEPTPLPQLVPQNVSAANETVGTEKVAGRYRVLRRLSSESRSSDVYLAKNGRVVAVKVLRPSIAQTLPEQAFDAAMKRAVRVHHEHVVEVYEYGRAEEGYFVAMEYVEGVSLAALFRALAEARERLPLKCALTVGNALAQGLAAVHGAHAADGRSLGLVHGALAPSKVLLGRRGTVKIADLGLSLVLPRGDALAPEAAAGRIDVRSDVFAVGSILRELLGRSQVPRALDAVVQRALRASPDDRYPSCGELAHALDRFLAEAGDSSAPTLGDWVERLRV